VEPSTPGTPQQHPRTLGTAEAVAVEQISITTTVADFASTKPESLTSWQCSWSCTLPTEPQPAGFKGWQGSAVADGAGQPQVLHHDFQGQWGRWATL